MAHMQATLAFAKKLVEQGLLKSSTATAYNRAILPLSKYYKYGLLTDDLIKDNPITAEALRRLPREVFFERQFRLARSINLSGNKSVLPESDWLKAEEDVSYLKPFIEQVMAEIQEKKDWDAGKFA